MAYVYPRLNPDVRFQQSVVDGEELFFYSTPVAEGLYRFNELQHQMLQRLDGKTSLHEVAQQLSDTFETEIPVSVAQNFVNTASQLMLLDNFFDRRLTWWQRRRVCRAVLDRFGKDGLPVTVQRPPATGEPALSCSKMVERLRAYDPRGAWAWLAVVRELAPEDEIVRRFDASFRRAANRIFARGGQAADTGKLDVTATLGVFDSGPAARFLASKVGFLFTAPWLLVTVALYLATLVLAADLELPSFALDPAEVLIMYGVFMMGFAWHELCHATALARLGRSPGNIGFGLLHGFIPMAYTDTTEVILLPRRQRLLVFTAGAVGDIFVIFLAVGGLHLLQPDHVMFRPLFAFIVYQLVMVFRNADPSMRLDGYNILTEFVKEQDLYNAAFGYSRAWVRRLFHGSGEVPVVPPGKKILYLVFSGWAITSLTAVYYLLVVKYLLGWLVESYRGYGLVAWVLIVGYLGHGQIKTAALQLYAFAGGVRQWMRRPRTAALGIALIAVPLALLFGIQLPVHIEAPFVVAPTVRSVLRVREPGQLRDVLVEEGQQVEEGQLLAVLQSPELSREVAAARARLVIAEQQLRRVLSGHRPERVAQAEAAVGTASAEAHFSLQQYARVRALAGSGAVDDQSLMLSHEQAEDALAERQVSRAHLDLVLAGYRREEQTEARARVESAKAELAHLLARSERLQLRAPCAGVVAGDRPKEKVGAFMEEGADLFEVIDVQSLRADIKVPSWQPMEDVSLGDEVKLKLNGYPDLGGSSRVASVSRSAISSEEGQAVEFHTVALSSLPQARSGLSGQARIYGRSRSLAYRWIFSDVIRACRYDFWSLF